MAICSKCGAQVEDQMKFCHVCGAPMEVAQEAAQQTYTQEPVNQAPVQNQGAQSATNDVEQNKMVAMLSYLFLLVLIPMFTAKESPFARYHANQGLNLCVVTIGWSIVSFVLTLILSLIPVIGSILGSLIAFAGSTFLLVLAVMGIINALQGQTKPLFLLDKLNLNLLDKIVK